MIQFADLTGEEAQAVRKISQRAARFCPPRSALDFWMDIAAVHASNPLRLGELAKAPDGDFFHDIRGIERNLNRKTGQLENSFDPRYSV